MNLVTKQTSSGMKKCYFLSSGANKCSARIGNANCFGSRFQAICPCGVQVTPEIDIDVPMTDLPTEAPPVTEEVTEEDVLESPTPTGQDPSNTQSEEPKCNDGYSCQKDDIDSNLIWAVKEDGEEYTCSTVCQKALSGNGDFYSSAVDTPNKFTTLDDLAQKATDLGFECKKGQCWNGQSPIDGMLLVNKGPFGGLKDCYVTSTPKISCSARIGPANCFGQRFQPVCPCKKSTLENACTWDSPPNAQAVASFEKVGGDGTSCVERINYWRKRACEEGWVECPPEGLPPYVECSACRNCANSQSAYDKIHGSHKSFTRCGDRSQGSGGGNICAGVIDMFVSERKADENDVVRCKGHFGPIVKHGCQTFFWGESD